MGAYGLEASYDDVLSGSTGLTITPTNVNGTPLLFSGGEQMFDAENGSSLVLTLDTNVQYALEKGLESMLDKYDAANGGTGIVMDVNTGGIVAMASYPNYDPGDFSTIYTEGLQAELDAALAEIQQNRSTYETEEAYNQALANARATIQFKQWRNKCYQDTYEPGSTFKPITLATALEEGVVNMNTTFTCTGSIHVEGWGKAINCSKRAGHGTQTLKVATGNSCNPAFVTMGLKIGTEAYYRYLKSFGLMETTGIDLPAEAEGIFANEDSFNSNVVSLAAYSFGQTFNVTPLELIRAQAATINGGYLYTPYLVEQVLDDEGNILSQHETTAVRQVISEETSAKVRECLEWVVSGGGRNGQVTGYRIGGKTGTADKTGTKDVVVSFMCFAPADDPQYIMLLTMDTPSRTTGTAVFGGTMVAPVASQIMSEILPLLGVEPDYTAEELVGADTTVPNVVGQTREAAEDRLADLGFTFRTVGDGDTVTDPRRRRHRAGKCLHHPLPGAGEAGHPLHRAQCGGEERLRGQQGHHQRRTYHEGDRYHHSQLRQCLRHYPVSPCGHGGGGGHGGDRPVRRQLCPGLRKQVLHGFWHLPPYTLQIPLFIMRDGKLLPD